MAVGKKEFFNLVVRHFTLLYLRLEDPVSRSPPTQPRTQIWTYQTSPPPQPSVTHDNWSSTFISLPTPTPASQPPSPSPAPEASSQDSVYAIGSPIIRHARVNGVQHHCTIAGRKGSPEERYQTLLDTASKATNARIVISGLLPTYSKGCEKKAGVRSTASVSWTTGHRSGSSRLSTGGTGFILVV
ncbi:hypothetical protein NFI96_019614 [Prochilodus magdalenae]|nr:hypothetical protein NFI96_019614 [Prochilodus magdalenae]